MCSSSSFSPDESSRARRLLASIAQLQPLIFGLSEELLATSLELNAGRLEGALENLTQQVREKQRRSRTNRAIVIQHYDSMLLFLSFRQKRLSMRLKMS